MRGRVESFVPDLVDRANIGTFHSFCAQILRQHGVHLDIKPDFIIYSQDADRKALFEDGLRAAAGQGSAVSVDDVRLLPIIDRFKSRLLSPQDIERVFPGRDDAKKVAIAYSIYENELRRLNALDFNSLIFEAFQLGIKYPQLIGRYRRTYSYWLIDEFQDTNDAQYKLLKMLAGADFRNVFAVADDDQIIYQWNGASFKNLQAYLKDFAAQTLQLPTNFRCPPVVVEAANRLVAYNVNRTADKRPLIAGREKFRFAQDHQIQIFRFGTDEEEAAGIAGEIAKLSSADLSSTAVIGRTRATLEKMMAALQAVHVPAVIAQRRDDFLSFEFRWLSACLAQASRPLDKKIVGVLVGSFNSVANIDCSVEQVIAEAEASGRSYLHTWLGVISANVSGGAKQLADAAERLSQDASKFRTFVTACLNVFGEGDESNPDLEEDVVAWRQLYSDIERGSGRGIGLDQFLQELQLRSKEPAPKPGTVTLTTVHSAKGREFEQVFVVGLAEDVMPSFQSRQKGDASPEMEEERRNCFVAITRTKERLVLSYADRYRGWAKAPSRFLLEMFPQAAE
ncbi:ATP-dependent DNA helicase PcrA [Bradyrhizobium ivorense]|nr:ATP-dependent DNA helicase PcrA [Bradyrhizobium ivorense]